MLSTTQAACALLGAGSGRGEGGGDQPAPQGRLTSGARGVFVGAHAGFDMKNDAIVVGAQSHLIADPWGRIDVIPNMDVTFISGITEYQFNAEAAAVVIPGLYVGGGAAFRNTVYEDSPGADRETRRGYTLFVGIRPPSRSGGLTTQAELRRTSVDRFRPVTLTVGLNYPLTVWR